VRQLRDWIETEIHLGLTDAPFNFRLHNRTLFSFLFTSRPRSSKSAGEHSDDLFELIGKVYASVVRRVIPDSGHQTAPTCNSDALQGV
jgi:hypothetical protein